MSLAGYVVRRLLQMILVIFGVTFLVFFLIHLVPGDPARTILGTKATPEKIRLLHEEWGLDKPLPVQYERYMKRLVRGDLGTSLFYDVPAGAARARAPAGHALADRPRSALLGADRRPARNHRRRARVKACPTT